MKITGVEIVSFYKNNVQHTSTKDGWTRLSVVLSPVHRMEEGWLQNLTAQLLTDTAEHNDYVTDRPQT
jgi:hypothetical protein